MMQDQGDCNSKECIKADKALLRCAHVGKQFHQRLHIRKVVKDLTKNQHLYGPIMESKMKIQRRDALNVSKII
jgi:hypothetical protein